MPLRDHFRPPVWNKSSWEGFHGGWPMTMVMQLARVLPEEYTAEPRVHLGTNFEIDVCAYEDDEPKPPTWRSNGGSGGGASATAAAPQPTSTVEVDLTEEYAYEVRVYDQSRARQLVAAIEIASPANKDRPENRRAFVTKCAALLQEKVCVSIVDLVTTRHFNLYAELREFIDRPDPALATNSPATYAATCRGRKAGNTPLLDSWFYPMIVGHPLPTIPVWLTEDQNVLLDLESSYEETCRALRLV